MNQGMRVIGVLGLLIVGGASRAQADSSDWPSYNGSLDSKRYSTLAQLTNRNVKAVTPVCSAELGEVTSMQSGPVVVSGRLYVTTALSTFSIDGANCAILWKHTYQYETPAFDLQVNRGVAFLDGRLFRGAQDGSVYALDANTGAELWHVKPWDGKKGETVSAAPIAWQGMVFVGNGMGDFAGVTGRVYAFDAATGKEAWHFDTVARDSDGAASWGSQDRLPSGGGTWTSYSLDETRGLLYVPVGNPAPDFLIDVRPGSNQYTNSVIVLDAHSGALKGYYPLVKQDFHDWDVGATPALLTTSSGVHMAATAAKDGYLYGLDRDSGTIRYRAVTTRIENDAAPLTSEGTRYCPGSSGGTEWNGPAFLPALNLIYVNAVDWCSIVKIPPATPQRSQPPPPGMPWGGSAEKEAPFGSYEAARSGWITAVDADSGEVRWKYHATSPMLAGIVATAGGIVLTAEERGVVLALDAKTGAVLYQFDTGQPIGGGVVTYATRTGAQRVAVAVGMNSRVWQTTDAGPAKLMVLGLSPKKHR